MKNIIISILFAIVASYFTVQTVSLTHETKTAAKETAYERVLRTGILRCGYVNWQPYYLKDPNTGTPSGMSYDIMTEVGKVLDLKIDWVEEVGWGTIGEGFKTGRYDSVCTSMWPDAGKYKNMSLSVPIFFSNIVAYARTNDNRFDGHFERINQKDVRVAVIDGAFTYSIAKANFPEAQIVALPQMAQESEYLMMVPSNKADIILSDIDELEKFLEANPDKMRMVKDIKPVKRFPHVIAMPPNEAQLTQMINQALQLLIDNGYMAEIKEKYKTEYALPRSGFLQ